MTVVRYDERLNVLVVAKGQPYLRGRFIGRAVCGSAPDETHRDCLLVLRYRSVGGQARCRLANRHLAPRRKTVPRLGFYDIPGLDFGAADELRFVELDPAFESGLLTLAFKTGTVAGKYHGKEC